jgi:hypothetical protein
VTRLRLKDPALLDDFFTAAVASLEQAKKADGNLGSDVLADANNLFTGRAGSSSTGYYIAGARTVAELERWIPATEARGPRPTPASPPF